MREGDAGAGFRPDVRHGALLGGLHPVGGQSAPPAEGGIEPFVPGGQARVVQLGVLQEQAEHEVVVAAQRDPGGAARGAHAQELDHLGALGAAVHEVAQVHHRRVVPALAPAVGADALVGARQLVEMAVHVADGVGASHSTRSGSESKAFLSASPQPWLMVWK